MGDFNYYNPIIDTEKVPDQHADFVNETGTVHNIHRSIAILANRPQVLSRICFTDFVAS